MSVVIYVKQGEQRQVIERIKSMNLERRLSFIIYISKTDNYPVNKLRNLAIVHSQTNHFWLADMDMWPSGGYKQ